MRGVSPMGITTKAFDEGSYSRYATSHDSAFHFARESVQGVDMPKFNPCGRKFLLLGPSFEAQRPALCSEGSVCPHCKRINELTEELMLHKFPIKHIVEPDDIVDAEIVEEPCCEPIRKYEIECGHARTCVHFYGPSPHDGEDG